MNKNNIRKFFSVSSLQNHLLFYNLTIKFYFPYSISVTKYLATFRMDKSFKNHTFQFLQIKTINANKRIREESTVEELSLLQNRIHEV